MRESMIDMNARVKLRPLDAYRKAIEHPIRSKIADSIAMGESISIRMRAEKLETMRVLFIVVNRCCRK